MSRTHIATIAAALLVSAVALVPSAGASGPAGSVDLLVKFAPSATAAQRGIAIAAVAGNDKRTIADIGVHVVSVPAQAADHALGVLRSDTNVAFAERDAVLQPQEQLPNDPYFLNSGSWNLGGGAWGWYATHTTQAWDITEGDPNVVIAILDTGIKTSGLTDFNGQIASTWNVLNNTSDATTNAGNHGTYVAGVAGLALDNGVGNAGYCPKCRLMIVQVGTDSGATLSNIAAGLTYAADHGARVANMSWAGTTDSATLQSAINYAHSKGLVLTAAAGNSNCNCATYPAADQNVLGVAGVSDSVGDKQGDSNYGSWVKVAAPEGNMTAWPTINGAPGYGAVGGTSVAAPAAAAIAALLFSYDPSLTNTQVESALEQSAVPVKFTIAYGQVDALAALQAVGASDPQPLSAPVQTAPPQIYYELNGWTSLAPLTNAPQVGQVLVRGIGGWTGSAGLSVSNLQWLRCTAMGTSCVYLTNQSTYSVQSADVGYTIKLSFSVGNGVGSVPAAVLSQPVGGTTVSPPADSSPPTISGLAQAGQTLTASTGSWSGSPTGFAYQWLRCSSGCASISGATSSTYTAQSADVASALEVSVTATNSAGSTTATSAPTPTVVAASAGPANTAAPSIAGTPQAGQTLTSSTGSWSGTPTGYAYQWLRCSPGCASISGATSSTYSAQSADVGSTLEVSVTATNSFGSATATSAPTAAVAAAASSPSSVTFSGALNPQNPSRTFSVSVGSGLADARLSFSKCSSLTLAISNGASANGPSVVVLDQTLSAGTYTYSVSGGKCSFTLTITAPGS